MRFRGPDEEPAITAAGILRLLDPLRVDGSASMEPDRFASLALLSVDAPELSGPQSLTFVGPKTPLRVRAALRAAFIIAEAGVPLPEESVACLRVHSIHGAMAAILIALADRIHRPAPYSFGKGNRIAPTAVVEGCLEGDVVVGAGAFVGRGSFIGAGSRIEPNAVIQDHCLIGRNCVVQSGAVIGSAGFGFFAGPAGRQTGERTLTAMPHLAGVEIGADCWIGANAVVAAGVLNPTVLGWGCKLDSHVQIAHNVRLGEECLLASQSGIAGSTVVGHRLRMGGASSIDGHLRLGDDVSVAACSGVTKDLADKSVVAGFPARPIKEWRRQWIALKGMSKKG